MVAPGKLWKSLAGAVLGLASAYLVAIALGTAYRNSEIFDVAFTLVIPPAVLFFVYRGSEKRLVFCAVSVLLAAIFFDLCPAFDIPRNEVSLFLLTMAAAAAPVMVDLSFIDMGRQIHVGRLARAAELAFVLALVPLAGWKVARAHQTILKEDQRLVGVLAAHLEGRGNALVVDKLDPKTSRRALRRLAIITDEKSYSLSDAAVESVRETHTVRKVTNSHGREATEITREQEDRMRLILKLQGTELPDDVWVVSRRGPLTIYAEKVPVAKSGS